MSDQNAATDPSNEHLDGGRITYPLRKLALESPDELFNVVIRILVDTALDPSVAYGSVRDFLDAIASTIESLLAKPGRTEGERITWNGREASAPFLYATLTGAHLAALDEELPPSVAFEIRRERVRSGDVGGFDPSNLIGRVIAEPLAATIQDDPNASCEVIIVLDAAHVGGRQVARETVRKLLDSIAQRPPVSRIRYRLKENASHPYVFAAMTGAQVLALVELDRNPVTGPAAIFRVWEDTTVKALITKSIATVKADAAQIAYSALGKGIVWAVLDSGIDGTHPHFVRHQNLTLKRPLRHRDFTNASVAQNATDDDPGALVDAFGHGTHVAGIMAGVWSAPPKDPNAPAPFPPDSKLQPVALRTTRNEAGADERHLELPPVIAGMAPQCSLVSMRVLDDKGSGKVSAIMDAFDEIQMLNDYGRRIVVHGVNLSVGYPFDANWFACGQSPLCVEVDRLVRSGVVVVAAAGNSGYGYVNTAFTKVWAMGLPMSINDPGNADLAITVGSTHRESPHVYGVSYFSSKGPTGDGRQKPDLVAPGERIVSCASAQSRLPVTITKDGGSTMPLPKDGYTYKEDSGTSMASPHVSGLIASFLSIRGEFIGRPDVVKEIFVANATDLKRDRTYQGAGLVDLIRAIQAV